MDIGRQKNKDVADINAGDKSISRSHENDLISRQAAIYIASGYCHPANIAQELAKLPPAEPELPEWAKKIEEYRKSAPSYIQNPLAWALYQTWKEYDR